MEDLGAEAGSKVLISKDYKLGEKLSPLSSFLLLCGGGGGGPAVCSPFYFLSSVSAF